MLKLALAHLGSLEIKSYTIKMFSDLLQPIDHISSSGHPRCTHPEIFQQHFPTLIDLAATPTPKYTCFTNHINSLSKSRIDYILLDPKLIHPTHRTFTLLLPNDSDHRAVISTFSKQQRSQTWRLNSAMLQEPRHKQVIHNILATHSNLQYPHQWDDCKDKIQSYLKAVGRPAARCRREGIKNLTNRLYKLQQSPSPSTSKITAIQAQLKSLQDIQARSIAIRSRVRWIEQGEQSTRYFYQRFRTHRSNTNISELHISDDLSTPPSTDIADITQFTTDHFTNLWSSSPPLAQSPLSRYIPQLPIHSIRQLTTPISTLEISQAIQSKDDNSAPGPDGLTYIFYRTFISPMTSILSNIAQLISQGLPPPPSWSNTYTILLHKKNQDPSHISNRRPITLANTYIKIISTALSTRIQIQAANLIHHHLHDFMKR